jgi:hypothetical protein
MASAAIPAPGTGMNKAHSNGAAALFNFQFSISNRAHCKGAAALFNFQFSIFNLPRTQ